MAAQEKSTGFYAAGFHYGQGRINNFLFSDEDYAYEVKFHKLPVYYNLKKGKFDIDLLFQPEYNRARQELLNFWFVDTDKEREIFMRPKTINEYILSVGIIVRKDVFPWLNAYVIASVGPGYFDRGTERVAKGFAFSDVLGLGLRLKISERFSFQFQPTVRHISNANLKKPNSGHNSLNWESGLVYCFE
ncbi:MAG: acyloxyacyl hydrolase [Leeuwenhoekiella sp.]